MLFLGTLCYVLEANNISKAYPKSIVICESLMIMQIEMDCLVYGMEI